MRDAGISVCSGGILGLGEADEDAGDTELLMEEVFDDVGVET